MYFFEQTKMNTIYFDIYENRFEKSDKYKHFVFEVKNTASKFYEYPFKAVLKDSSDELKKIPGVKGFMFDKKVLLEFLSSKFKASQDIVQVSDLKDSENELTGFLLTMELETTVFDIMRLVAESACMMFKELNGMLCYDSRFEENIDRMKNKYAMDALTDCKKKEYMYKFIDFSKGNLSAECYGLLPKMFCVTY